MKNIIYLLLLISYWSYSQKGLGEVNLDIHDSWSRENSYHISIIPDTTSGEEAATITIHYFKLPEEVIKINAEKFAELKGLLSKIKYPAPDKRGDFCADGTTVTLNYDEVQKKFIAINCFLLNNPKYKEVCDVVQYIIGFTKNIYLDSK